MRFLPNFLFLLLVSLFLMTACSSKKEVVEKGGLTQDAQLKHFYRTDDLTNILDQAVKENKLVYVDIYADWCLPCKVMNESVYGDKEAMDYLNDNFICYKLDGEKVNGPNLVALWQISNYPGLLFLNQRGGVLEKNLGSMTKAELMAMGDRALMTSLTQVAPKLLEDSCTDVGK